MKEGISDIASKEWGAYIDPFRSIAERTAAELLHPDDAQLRQEMYCALFSELAAGYLALLHADPRHPDFWPLYNPAFRVQASNPDIVYHVTPVDDAGTYKISGFRGTVRRVSFTIGTGTLYTRGTMDGGAINALAEYDLDDLSLDEDGSFEVVLSPEQPKDYQGDWWKLGAGATHIMVRQFSYDWLGEVNARLAIERLDLPAIKPRPGVETLIKNMTDLARWTEGSVQVSIGFFKMVRNKIGFNRVGYTDNTDWAPVVNQRYAYGGFDLAQDEALIVEAMAPHCRYWSIQLTDDFGVNLDWINRQTSLNGHTARVDEDGVFRAVISARDPGVPNWLDNAGYRTGAIQVRWEYCDKWPEEHITNKVKVAEVRDYLPAGTPRISSEQRDVAIRVRRKGAQMRRRW